MIRTLDIAWAAGFLEGEGSFVAWGPNAVVSASQVQPEPLLRLQSLFGGKLYSYKQTNPKHSPYMRWHLNHREARGLMMTIYVFMSPKRRQQIVKAIAPWKARGRPWWTREVCPKGHPYTPANTYINKTTNGRQCIACRQRWGYYPKARKRLRSVNQLDFPTDS